MWGTIYSFEMRYHLGQRLFPIAAALLFALGVLIVSTDLGPRLAHAPIDAFRNAPYLIVRHLTGFALIGLFLTVAYAVSSLLRDFEQNTWMFFQSKPVRTLDFLTARFAAGMTISVSMFLFAIAGMMVGSLAPWQDPARIGPFRLDGYLFGLFVLVLPNLFSMGAILYAIAAWTRRRMFTYLALVLFLFLQDFVEELVTSFDSDRLAGLIEPTGLVALEIETRYWTTLEFNTQLPELFGPLLMNRILWILVGSVALAWGLYRFKPERAARRRQQDGATERSAVRVIELPAERDIERSAERDTELRVDDSSVGATVGEGAPRRSWSPSFMWWTPWYQWLRQTGLEIGQVLRGIPFIILVIFDVVFVFTFAAVIGEERSMASLPLTRLMLQAIGNTMQAFLTAIVIVYAGEMAWRERSNETSDLFDAMPVGSWVYPGAKLAALAFVVLLVTLLGVATTVAYQLLMGFTHIEPDLYLRGAGAMAASYSLLIALAFLIMSVCPNRLVGYLTIIAVLFVRKVGPMLGLEHKLFYYGSHPALRHSDVNGFGQHAEPRIWFGVHWGLVAALFVIASILLWVRGRETSPVRRLARARSRWRGGLRPWTLAIFVGTGLTGAWIVYNTTMVNDFVSRSARLDRRAEYERRYAEYAELPLPRIAVVRSRIDIDPGSRSVHIRGSYELVNEHEQPIRLIPITIGPRSDAHDYLPFRGAIEVERLSLPAHDPLIEDEALGFRLYELQDELAPGGSIELDFELTAGSHGFVNGLPDDRIVGNGTFFANKNLMPSLGYVDANELHSTQERRKRGLAPRERARGAEDPVGLAKNYLQADWTRYETVITTSADQIALAPGELVEQWSDGNRRCFRYQTVAPMVNLAGFMSARYEVARDRWEGVDLEVYYHRDHAYNLRLILDAAKSALRYCSAQFGPYPHSLLRIVEVPGYIGHTAIALSHTIIFSETWGFTSKPSKGGVDITSLTVAHETAHQWWNHQLVPADVQGATLIAEGIAEYASYMIMREREGPGGMGGYLDYARNFYLKGRGGEEQEERPLVLLENQPYLHYGKAPLAFYTLQDVVGEAELNQALAKFLGGQRFQGPPYPTANELLETLRALVSPDHDGLITDLFENITLYDKRLLKATAVPLADGKWRLTVDASIRKLRVDASGIERELPFDDWMEIAVYGIAGDGEKGPALLTLHSARVVGPDPSFDIVVEGRPETVVIDPYHKLIDRVSPDDRGPVTRSFDP